MLEGIVKTLLNDHNMSDASDVVLTGSSAGGIGALHQCDNVGSLVEDSASDATYKCLVDAGFFVNTTDFDGGTGTWTSQWETMVTTHGAMSSMSSSCKDEHEDGKEWECWFADTALPYVSYDVFLVQSVMDLWQLPYNFFSSELSDAQAGHDCLNNPLRMCTYATFAGIQSFREQLLVKLKEVASSSSTFTIMFTFTFMLGSLTTHNSTTQPNDRPSRPRHPPRHLATSPPRRRHHPRHPADATTPTPHRRHHPAMHPATQVRSRTS